MPIATTCPHCDAEYALADHLGGQKVRCKKCKKVISVPASSKRPAARDEATPRRGKRPEPSRPKRKEGSKRGLWIAVLGIGAVLLLIGCSGVFAFLYFSGRTAGLGSDLLVDTSPPWPEPFRMAGVQGNAAPETIVTLHIAGVVDRATEHDVNDRIGEIAEAEHLGTTGHANLKMKKMTVLVSPVKDIQAFADKLKFGTVRSVKGQTIILVVHKVDGPPDNADQLTWLLFDLKSKNRNRRVNAVRGLVGQPADGRREEVARLLLPMLDDPDKGARGDVCRAMTKWGTPQCVPGLINALKDKDSRVPAMEALGQLQDPRAIEPLIEWLGDSFYWRPAADALKRIGAASEKPLLRCLSSPDKRTRESACQILKDIGTQDSLPALQKATTDSESAVAWHAKEAVTAISRRR